MQKQTNNSFTINNLSVNLWSTRMFDNKPVEQEKINSILEAARWAPSAFNAQPWKFIVGISGSNNYDKILDTLVDWNIQWAKNAPVLILNIAEKYFSHNGKPNSTYKYDLGQAVAMLSLEAVNQGLTTHQMTGFDPEKAHKVFNLSNDLEVVSVIAVGYYSSGAEVPEEIAKLENNARERKNHDELVIGI